MNITELVEQLAEKGVVLSTAGEELLVRGERGALVPALVEQLRLHKAELIDHIRAGRYRAPSASGIADYQIPANCERITPEMLPLLRLDTRQIEDIAATVPGGAANIQDIYPLTPLQEGLLFQHLLAPREDPYLQHMIVSFRSRVRLEAYVNAMQRVVDRYDMLRTSICWQGLTEPVQVVWRRARLQVTQAHVRSASEGALAQLQLSADSGRRAFDLTQAPLLRLYFSHDAQSDRWLLLVLCHHVAVDHAVLGQVHREIQHYLSGRVDLLPAPRPFRNFVVRAKFDIDSVEQERFFREMLKGFSAAPLPFGLRDESSDARDIDECDRSLDPVLGRRLRECARALGVTPSSIFHVAWAAVLARASGQDDVVFGTVLLGDSGDGGLGMHLNTLPVRLTMDDRSAEQSVRDAHRLLAGLLRHQHASLALAQRASGVAPPSPLITSLLNFRHAVEEQASSVETDDPQIIGLHERTSYPLTLNVGVLRDTFILHVQVDASQDAQRIVEMMHTALERLVHTLRQRPWQALRKLDVLPERQREQLLVQFNASARSYERNVCLHELFERQATRTPQALALIDERESLSYAALDARANALAVQLRTLGVGAERRVALCMERSTELVVALLAVLKAGGAYVPLDPAYPPERLSWMLTDSAPVVLLMHEAVQAALAAQLAESCTRAGIVRLSVTAGVGSREGQISAPTRPAVPAAMAERSDECNACSPSLPTACAQQLAYVIYTSGSTGQPKGVMNTHAAVVNRLQWMQEAYGLSADDAVLQKTSLSFDVSVWELFWPLLSGARLVLARPGGQKDARYLQGLLEQQQITTLHFVPSMLQGFVQALGDGALGASVRRVICSGEELPAALAQQVRTRWPQVALHNLYGPTEAAVDVSAWSCQGELPERIPIGAPIANTQLYVLDRSGEPTPIGVAGEIHIGGVQVARGYLHRAALTAERFIPDPFSRESGARLYRTGDLGRWRADGTIEYLGRNDFQVKVRGYRIELGEIEARLRAYPGIADAVVLADGEGAGERRLVAYYIVREATAPEAMRAPLSSVLPESAPRKVELEALRAHLSSVLPEYMVPAAFVYVETFPLTANGKLDRRALPAPEEAAYARQQYEPPRGAVEETLARLWSEVLGVAQVGRADNFFDLGGHSLLAIRLIERMRQQQLYAEVRALFTAPTLAALAQTLRTSSAEVVVPENGIPAGCTHITPEMLALVQLTAEQIAAIVRAVPGGAANVQDIYPLAPLQEGILFHHLMTPVGDPYVQQIVLGFAERACLERYLQALQQVIARHDILRTAVYWEGLPEPVQVVWREAPMQVQELSVQPGEDVLEQLRARFDPLTYRMEVRRAPLTRIFIAEDKAHQRWVLLQLYHHLIDDITSLTLLFAEVNAFLLQQEHTLPAPLPFRNFIAQARLGVSAAEHERFFQRLLSGVQAPSAPYGLRVRPGEALPVSEYRAHLPEGLSRRVRLQARALKVSAASLFHLAWAQVLARLCNQADVVFGTVLFGRAGAGSGSARTLGVFINTLPIRIAIDARGAREGVLHTHALLAELLHHEHASPALAQRCSSIAPPEALCHALLNYRYGNAVPSDPDPSVLKLAPGMEFIEGKERTNYPLYLSIDDVESEFDLAVQTQAPFGGERICAYLQQALHELVDALERTPERPLRDLEVLPLAEQQLLCEWNETRVNYPLERGISELFEAQARCTPNAVAYFSRDAQISFAQVNEAAWRLARELGSLGAGPEVLVGLNVSRSFELIIGMLGILRSGAAFVPLDPSYPPERLQYILDNARPPILLTQPGARERLGAYAGKVVLLNLQAPTQTQEHEPCKHSVESRASLNSRAYVMYTSGSSGQPKAVEVSHRQLLNRLHWFWENFPFEAGTVGCLKTSINFIDVLWEVFGYALRGAPTVLIEPASLQDMERLFAELSARRVTHLWLVPSLLSAMLDHAERTPAARLPALRFWSVGGEALGQELLERFRAQLAEAYLLNLYGLSEAGDVSYALYGPGLQGSQSLIGRPIANMQTYVLDGAQRLLPIGVVGELYVAGEGLARGYPRDVALSAEKFLPHSFGRPGERLYRTGDLARYRSDGLLEYHGRRDHQVKLRGYRVELGEIEAQLRSVPGISDVAVIARGAGADARRLVAYYRVSSAPASIEALRAHLSKVLPEYMVPAAFVQLESFPLTASGKLDRLALPEPDETAFAHGQYEAPAGEIEEQLARIWCEVLGVQRVGRQDQFFKLGGTSLSALAVVNRARASNYSLDARAMFTATDLAELASLCRKRKERVL